MARATFANLVACGLFAATVVVSVSFPARGQQAGLEGSWSGSGRVALPSGALMESNASMISSFFSVH